MFITTIEFENFDGEFKIDSLESWQGDTQKESSDLAIKDAEAHNISAEAIVSITTREEG